MENKVHKGRSWLVVATLLLFSPMRAQTLSVGGGLSDPLRSLAVDSVNTRVLVGGGFRYAGSPDSLLAKGIVAWEHDHWSMEGLADGSGDTLPAWYLSQKILFDMAMFHDTLFAVVGDQDWHYNEELNGIIYLVNNEWHPCAFTDNYVELMNCNGRLFGGGPADTVAGVFMSGAKEWVSGGWQLLPNSPFDNPLASNVECVTYWHERYYFAGLFNASGAHKVISWDGANDWAPVGDGLGPNWVNAIAGYGDTLYAGGFLGETPEQPSRHMRLWDGTTWRPFFPEVQFVDQVWRMEVYEGALYILGVHHHADDDTMYPLLRFDGQNLCSLGGPVTGGSGNMLFYQDTLYYGLQTMFPGLEYQRIGRLPLNGLVPDRCVTVATSIEEEIEMGGLRLYPNPASTSIDLQLPTHFCGERIAVYNSLGQKAIENVLHKERAIALNIQNLLYGAYSVVVSGEGQVALGRFIKD